MDLPDQQYLIKNILKDKMAYLIKRTSLLL